jgi:hypothetical protein
MKLIIEKKEFAGEFRYYEDQLGTREDKMLVLSLVFNQQGLQPRSLLKMVLLDIPIQSQIR